MKHYIATAFAASALLAAPARAQEFGAEEAAAPMEEPSPIQAILENTADLAGKPLGADMVEVTESLGDEEIEQGKKFKSPGELLNAYLGDKGYSQGWDEEKDRILVVVDHEFSAKNPEIYSDFISERSDRMQECLLRAKAEIISRIKQTMSGERMLEIPGNPLIQKFNAELNPLRDSIFAAVKELEAAQVDLDIEIKRQGTYSPEQLGKWAVQLLETFAKIDAGDLIAELGALDAKKKEALAELQTKVKESNAKLKDLKDRFDAELEAIKASVGQQSASTFSRASEMTILGCSVLKQAEGWDPAKGLYHIGVVFYWSRDMQRAAAAILQGERVEFAKGKKNRAQWENAKIKSGEWAWMLGPRTFIDDKGDLLFYGFSCYPYGDNAIQNRQQEGNANSVAISEVGYALFADAKMSEMSRIARRDRTKSLTETMTEREAEFKSMTSEKFQNISISGLGQARVPTTVELFGLEAKVVSQFVDVSSAKALDGIFQQSLKLGLDVRKSQAEQKGRNDALRARAAAAQDDAASYAAGQAAGNKIMDDHEREQAAKKAAAAAPKGNLAPAAPAPKKPAQPGRLQGGSRIIGDDDDDF